MSSLKHADADLSFPVASSDATNIRTSIRQEGNEIVINGHKWYVNLAGCPSTLR